MVSHWPGSPGRCADSRPARRLRLRQPDRGGADPNRLRFDAVSLLPMLVFTFAIANPGDRDPSPQCGTPAGGGDPPLRIEAGLVIRASPEAGWQESSLFADPGPAATESAAAWRPGPAPRESAASVAASPTAGPQSIGASLSPPCAASRSAAGGKSLRLPPRGAAIGDPAPMIELLGLLLAACAVTFPQSARSAVRTGQTETEGSGGCVAGPVANRRRHAPHPCPSPSSIP